MNNKPNDWIVAQLDNPAFNFSNFKEVGLSADNTTLQGRDKYKASTYIQDKFKDDGGKFNEAAFNKFYDNAAASYQTFANNQFTENVTQSATWDSFDQLREGKAEQPQLWIEKVNNPDRLKTGVSRIGRTDNREWTASELAQKEKVFDYETGEWKDYSSNDRTLFNNPIGFFKSLAEPLVLAQWDEDGTHPDSITGRVIKHKKGDYKYNNEGAYFYETLGGREPYGKQIKSAFDSFTIDGGKGNRYDFFDSDGLDKSVSGTLFKTVANIAPLFLGPEVALAYGAVMVGTQLLDILPMIYKTSIGIGDEANTPTSNYLQSLGRSLRQGKSEYSQQNLISTENFFDLVTDVSLQWAQQRAIFSGVQKALRTNSLITSKQTTAFKEGMDAFGKNPMGYVEKYSIAAKKAGENAAEYAVKGIQEISADKAANALRPLLKKRNRAAANIALGYMAITQGSEVFEDALSQGASRTEAAAVTWGAIAGMYGIDRTGLGEIFFPELRPESLNIQAGIRSLGKEIAPIFKNAKNATKDVDKKRWYSKIFNSAKEKSHKYFQDIKNNNVQSIFGKMVGEGLEEVGEEFMTDFAKQTFNWASEMGITSTQTKLDAWENMGTRYAMNFFGGAIGGAIFGASDIMRNIKQPSKQNSQELAYLIRNKRTSEILDELKTMRDKGLLGNKNLSSTQHELDENGQIKWLSPSEQSDNQNEATYGLIKNYIQSLDEALNNNQMNLSDDQLLDKLMMSDIRMKNLLGTGLQGKMFQDFNTLTTKILEVEQNIKGLANKYSDPQKRNSSEYETELTKLQQDKANLLAERDKFYDGNYSKYYVDQMMFALDNEVNQYFFASNFRNYAEYRKKTKYENISEEQLKSLKEDYETYLKSEKLDDLNLAYDFYKTLNEKSSLKVQELGQFLDEFIKYKKKIKDTVFEGKSGALNKFKNREEDLQDKNPYGKLKKEFSSEPFQEIEGEPNESKLARQQQYLDLRKAKFERVLGLLQEVKKFGFIDSDTRRVFMKILDENVDLTDAFYTAELSFKHSDLFRNMAFPSIQEGVLEALKQLKLDNAESIKSQLAQFIVPRLGDSEFMTMENLMENSEDPIEDSIKLILKEYSDVIDKTVEEYYKMNPEIQVVVSELSNVKENPLVDYLQDMSKEIFGEDIEIINMINDEENRFKNVPSVMDYIIEGDRTKELVRAIQVLNTMEAIIKASATVDTDTKNPFGHNQSINDFLERNFPNADRYGVVRADIAQEMLNYIDSVKDRIAFLVTLSRQNAVNRFAEHTRTGKNLARLLYRVFSNKGEYEFLKGIEYKGVKLFDGIENIESPLLDSATRDNIDTLSDEIFAELSKYQDLVYDNFQKAVQASGESQADVFSKMFINVRDQFSSLEKQENTRLNSQTESLTDYDVYLKIATSIALKKSDFNYYLKEVLTEDGINFAPLESQQAAVEMAIATRINPEVMNSAIQSIKFKDEEAGSELIRLPNIVMVNGIGGAGKTSVIANLTNRISKKMDPTSTIWKSGPEKMQVTNLSNSLKTEGKEYTIEELMQVILPTEVYGGLHNDIQNSSSESDWYKIEGYSFEGATSKVAIANEAEYNNVATPKILFIDEITHINSIYLQHLSRWASKNKVTIVGLGDLNQNGYEDIKSSIYNIDSNDVMVLRSPKIDISMRVTNNQKNDNVNNSLAVLNSVDYNDITYATPSQVSQFADLIKNNLLLKYFSDKENPLNGEIITKELDVEQVNKLLKSSEKIGYVYDNPNSPTYKMLKDLNNPNIVFYTKKSVQGSELDYFIIDTTWNQYDLTSNITVAKDFMKDYYTLMTRSKKGTYFIDNGLSNIISIENNIEQDYTANTIDPTQIIQKFREDKLSALEKSLENYAPANEPEKVEQPIVTNTEETVNGLSDDVKTILDDVISISTGASKESTPNLEGVRAYGWYMRDGLIQNADRYEVVGDKVREDFNIFIPEGVESIGLEDYNDIKAIVVSARDYLLYNHPFDDNFIKSLASKYPFLAEKGTDFWNSGEYKIRIRPYDERTDKPIDKEGLNYDKIQKVSFDVIYSIPNGNSRFDLTIGKLTDPDTWINWVTEQNMPASIAKTAVTYKKWYDGFKQINEPKYFDLDKATISFSGATRLTPIMENDKRVKFQLTEFEKNFPHTMRSPIYIYSGHRGDVNVDNKILGRAVMFVTNNKNLTYKGTKVTSDTLANYYLEQKRNPENFNPEVRMIVLDANGVNVVDYFLKNFEDLQLTENMDENSSKIRNYLGTIGSINTAARIFANIWNYNAGLINLIKAYDDFMNNPANSEYVNGEVLNKKGIIELNRLLDTTKTEFRILLDSSKTSISIDKISAVDSKNEPIRGVHISYDFARMQQAVLDELLNNLNKLVNLPTSRDYIIGEKGMKEVLDSLKGNNNSPLILRKGNEEYRHQGFTGAGAFKLMSILESMTHIQAPGVLEGSKYLTLDTTDKNGNAISLDLASSALKIGETFRSNYPTIQGGLLFNSLLNTVLSGNPRADGDVKRTYASFPNGIYYRPRYAVHTNNNFVSDFYSAMNADNQFYSNVAIEAPNFEINIPNPNTLKETEQVEVITEEKLEEEFIPKERRLDELEEFKSQALSLFDKSDIIQTTIINGNKIAQTALEMFKEGKTMEESLDWFKNNILNSMNNTIELRNLKTRFGDIILKVELNRPKTKFVVKSTLYTSLAIVNSSLIEKTKGGKVDMTQFENIEFEDGNRQNFVITLQNGNSLAGRIEGTEVKLLPSSVYNIQMGRESQLALDRAKSDVFDVAGNENPIYQLLDTVSKYTNSTGMDLSDRLSLGEQALIMLNALENSELGLAEESEMILASGIVDSEGVSTIDLTPLKEVLNRISTLRQNKDEQCKISLI